MVTSQVTIAVKTTARVVVPKLVCEVSDASRFD